MLNYQRVVFYPHWLLVNSPLPGLEAERRRKAKDIRDDFDHRPWDHGKSLVLNPVVKKMVFQKVMAF